MVEVLCFLQVMAQARFRYPQETAQNYYTDHVVMFPTGIMRLCPLWGHQRYQRVRPLLLTLFLSAGIFPVRGLVYIFRIGRCK